METVNIDKIVKGTAVRAGGVEIVPIARWSSQTSVSGERAFGFWVITPIGIQIVSATGTVGLDIDGQRSDELARL